MRDLEDRQATVASDLAERAGRSATEGPWASGAFAALAAHGVFADFLPADCAGHGAGEATRLDWMALVARHCLTTALVLSQWAAAVRLVADADPDTRRRLLPPLADGSRSITVGISQLSTSRRHLATAAVGATCGADGWRIDGECPWVTAADRSDTLVIGAVADDAAQRFFAVDTAAAGVVVGPPLPLSALGGSRTAVVSLTGVRPAAVLTPPDGGVRAGGLATIALAVGAARASIDRIAAEAVRRPALDPVVAAFRVQAEGVAATLRHAAEGGIAAAARDHLRARATGLVLRAAQAALVASKGAGFVVGHPAERLQREAAFFLVWSCPQAVAEAVIGRLTEPD